MGQRGDKVTGDWGRWQTVELHDVSSSSNISWVIKKRLDGSDM